MLMCAVVGLAATAGALADGPELPLGDFSDPADVKRWTAGDSGQVAVSLAPRAVTDSNVMLKVVMTSGTYPGIAMRSVPRDWSKYEAMRFVVWSDSPFRLNVRIDDSKSTDYKSRFNKTLCTAR